MNPTIINTVNVQQFGFAGEFNLLTKKLILSVADMSVFNPSGATNLTSIVFNVTDPIGYHFDPVTVNLSTLAAVEIALGSNISFGYWKISAVLTEQDGRVYTVEVDKQICIPEAWDGKTSKGEFEINVNCNTAKATVYDKTKYSYAKTEAIAKIYTGKLFYPDNILNETTITFTPFQVGGASGLYSGIYRINNVTLALYAIGDAISVSIPYKTIYDQEVECTNSLRNVLCCIEEAYSTVAANGNNTIGSSMQGKLNLITPTLMVAIMKDQNGKNVAEEVKTIRKILSCDCGCNKNEFVERSLIGGADNVTVVGANATTVTPLTSGDNIEYTVSSKLVSVVKSNLSDTAITISKTENSGTIVYAIGLNYAVISNTILTTIKGDTTLTQLFNEIVATSNSNSLSGLDGSCIIDLTKCDYLLSETAGSKIFKSILIGGQNFNAPGGMALSNAGAIASYLNGLGKGTFTVGFDSGTGKTTISAVQNVNVISTITITSSGTDSTIAFSKTCTTLVEILQGIIDYICAINADQVDLKNNITLQTTTNGTTIVPVTFLAGSSTQVYLEALATQISYYVQHPITGPAGIDGDDGISVQVFVQPNMPTGGTYRNGDIWIVQ